MANKVTKTAVACSNAQQVNPVHVVQNPKKETAEFDNNASNENKRVGVLEKKNGINLTLVPPRQQATAQKIKAIETISEKDDTREKDSQQDTQSLTLQPDSTFATPRTDAENKTKKQHREQGLLTEDAATDLAKGQMRKT